MTDTPILEGLYRQRRALLDPQPYKRFKPLTGPPGDTEHATYADADLFDHVQPEPRVPRYIVLDAYTYRELCCELDASHAGHGYLGTLQTRGTLFDLPVLVCQPRYPHNALRVAHVASDPEPH